MPRRSSKKSSRSPTSAQSRLTTQEKLAHVSKFATVDPTSASAISRKYNELKRVPTYLQRVVSDVDKLTALKRAGFFTTPRGVIVDGPRDGKRERIPEAKFRVNDDGVVVWSVKQRRDYIVGLTRADKKEFAKDPQGFTDKKLAELKAKYPALKRDPQVRLQWGAYQAQKDFAPQAFAKLSTWEAFMAMYGHGRRRQKSDVDRLTGLHFVVHLPKKRKTRGKKKK